MNLGENIYRFRIKHQLSQDDLAEKLGVSRQSVSKWENNNSVPDLEKLVKMADLFDVTLDELAGRVSSSPTQTSAEATSGRQFTRRQTVGIVFFCTAAFIFLYCVLDRRAAEGLLMALPVALCGIWCFTKLHHVGLWCVWTVCLPQVYTPLRYYFRADISWALTLALYLPLFVGTIWCLRNDPVPRKNFLIPCLVGGYLVCFLYLGNYIFQLIDTYYLYTSALHFVEATIFLIFTAVSSISVRILRQRK